MDRAWRVRSGAGELRIVRAWDWRGEAPAVPPCLAGWELDEVPRTTLQEICEEAFPAERFAAGRATAVELRERVRRGLDEGALLLLGEQEAHQVVRPGPIGNFFKKLKAALSGGAPPPPAARPPPPPAAQPAAAPSASSGLGANVDGLVDKSPSATRRLDAFQARNGTIEWGPSGGGSYYDSSAKKIVIDGANRTQPAAAMQALSHELGHAASPVAVDSSTRQKYVDSMLADEGEATMANCEARSEILANGGADIGVAGANSQRYQDIYAAHLQPNQRDEARQQIGQAFGSGEHTSTTGQTYSEYYGGAYDRAHPPAAAGGGP